MSNRKQDSWAEAQQRCRLSDEEIGMAKALSFQPHSLIKNIPSPSQQWKTPVNEWVRSLYERKFGSAPVTPPPAPPGLKKPARVIEFRNPDYPWPDKPVIPGMVVHMEAPDEFGEEDDEFDPELAFAREQYRERFEPPDDEDIEEENTLMLRRQCLFRWAAQLIAVTTNTLPEVQKVAAFGSVAKPLVNEVPRFRQYRRHRIEIYHECRDLDLAIWTTDLGKLKDMRKAMQRGLSIVQDTDYGGVANHQVDVHVFEASTDDYKGRLCIFNTCPKGKRECLVPGCGDEPFLQQFEKYRFNPARFAAELKIILADKATGFVVKLPVIDAKPGRIVYRTRSSDDVPF